MTNIDKILEEFEKSFWLHRVPNHTKQMKDIKSFIATSIAQAIAEERERVVEAMMMKGIEAKMTPFQTTVNQYLRNRAEEIGIVLSSLDTNPKQI